MVTRDDAPTPRSHGWSDPLSPSSRRTSDISDEEAAQAVAAPRSTRRKPTEDAPMPVAVPRRCQVCRQLTTGPCPCQKAPTLSPTSGAAVLPFSGATGRAGVRIGVGTLFLYPLCGMRAPGAPQTADSVCQQRGYVQAARVIDHIVPVTGPDDPTFLRRRRTSPCATRVTKQSVSARRWRDERGAVRDEHKP